VDRDILEKGLDMVAGVYAHTIGTFSVAWETF